MLKKITYPALFALLMVLAASCQKEEVKPFTSGESANCVHRDGEGGEPGSGNVPTDNPPTGGTGLEEEEEEGEGGITDGGNSSEHDRKGKGGKK